MGAFLVNKEKKVFMAERVSPKGAWQMPQGGIDDGETPKQALLRELKEEIGTNNVKILGETQKLYYDLPEESAKTFFNGIYNGQEQIWFALLFLGEDKDINLFTDKHSEFCKWEWVQPNELIERIVYFKKDLYKTIVEYMKTLNII